ncbi:MAG: hypothetical protein WBL67_20925 [Nitrososphaeraceae archaeon]
MNKFADNRMTIAVFLGLTSLLGFILFSSSSEVELLAQQQGTISIVRATALPLVNAEGNQVKVVINYSIGSESFLGQRVNAIMGIYDRLDGSLIKLSSFPNGFILNNTQGTIQLASTLTDPKIQNISTIVTLTNAEKSEKYSNDVSSDLDLRSILPTSLTVPTLNETLAPSSSPPLPPTSAENGENQDDSNSNSDEE